MYANVGYNQTKRMDCPFCGNERTLSITNDAGTLKWNCFHSSCSAKGTKEVELSIEDIESLLKHCTTTYGGSSTGNLPFNPRSQMPGGSTNNTSAGAIRPYYMPRHLTTIYSSAAILDGVKSLITQEPFLSAVNALKLNIQYDPIQQRVVFPVFIGKRIVGLTGKYIGRQPHIPKWLVYPDTNATGVFHVNGGKDLETPLILVEDCLSAMAVANAGYHGVALLGTFLSESKKRNVAAYGSANTPVYVAMDKDASVKGLSMIQDLYTDFNEVKLLLLDKDMKYLTSQEINAMVDMEKWWDEKPPLK